MAAADRLAHLVTDAAALELWDRPDTGAVNWRPRDHDPVTPQTRLRDASADIDEDSWVRSVPANPLSPIRSRSSTRYSTALANTTQADTGKRNATRHCPDQPSWSILESASCVLASSVRCGSLVR